MSEKLENFNRECMDKSVALDSIILGDEYQRCANNLKIVRIKEATKRGMSYEGYIAYLEELAEPLKKAITEWEKNNGL